MFTGLVQGQGQVVSVQQQGEETRLTVQALFAVEPLVLGESIAVNGVCLTVESCGGRQFTAYASAETMRRTNLGGLRTGSSVNLERALAVGDRMGGHIVSGHVDCTAVVASVQTMGQSRCVRLTFPAGYAPEVLSKGSVALDGVSLTINACSGVADATAWLEVNVIPETWRVTTVAHWQSGTRVNMETDVVGKYVRRMLLPWSHGQAHTEAEQGAGTSSGITEEFLQRNGFI